MVGLLNTEDSSGPMQFVSSPYSTTYPSSNFTYPSSSATTSQQTTTSQSPIGMSPSTVGNIAGKVLNGSFGDKFATATNSIDSAGTYLGFGAGSGPTSLATANGTATINAYGEVVNGAAGSANAGALTSSSLSSVLGSAGIGYIGGTLLSQVIGGNSQNAGIGGAIGAGLGAAIMGSEIGAVIGSFIPIPGLGTILGTVVGSYIGGQFGPKSPATNADTYQTTLGGTGGSEQSKNPGATAGSQQSVTSQFKTMASQAGQDLGIKFNPNMGIVGTISTRHPGPEGNSAIQIDYNGLDAGDGKNSGLLFYNPGDDKSVKTAQLKALTAAAASAGYTDTAKLTEWFNSYAPPASTQQANSGVFTPPSSPIIPLSNQTFAQYMAKQKGTPNGNAAPVPTA